MTTEEWIEFDKALRKKCGFYVESFAEKADFGTSNLEGVPGTISRELEFRISCSKGFGLHTSDLSNLLLPYGYVLDLTPIDLDVSANTRIFTTTFVAQSVKRLEPVSDVRADPIKYGDYKLGQHECRHVYRGECRPDFSAFEDREWHSFTIIALDGRSYPGNTSTIPRTEEARAAITRHWNSAQPTNRAVAVYLEVKPPNQEKKT